MRSIQLKRLLDSDVVGQLNNGLFFEGHVENSGGRPTVLSGDGQAFRRISARRVKWLVRAVRYC